ncbi:unnamed protein product, partial [Sphacelaria rigidula]
QTLREVSHLGLSIYGNGWDRSERAAEFMPFWRGILPQRNIAALYSGAKVVLATTEEKQRELGMVNNRVFEALACGAAVVTDAFPALTEIFGDHVLYYRKPGEARRSVEFLLENAAAREELGIAGRRLI